MKYSKTLDALDYDRMVESIHVDNVAGVLGTTSFRYEHTHRRWEYSLILKALRENKTITVLDVGGGGSLFAPAATMIGMEVVQVDPEPYGAWALEQSHKLRHPLPYIKKDFFDFYTRRKFDAVVSVSTIEHVEEDRRFFEKLMSHVKPGGILALTTDFHPSGEQKTTEHVKTYNEEDLVRFRNVARGLRFDWLGDGYDYTYRGEDVNNYTFASLILRIVGDLR